MILEAAAFCLALNLYHEARGEPTEGQIAVALVVMERGNYTPANYCSMVFEPYQFSWTENPQLYPVRDERAFNEALALSNGLVRLDEKTAVGMFGPYAHATHFHADYVRPYWAKDMTFIGQIGRHLFYRE